jgi:hypothetical protein
MYFQAQWMIGYVLYANNLLSGFCGGVYEGNTADIGSVYGESRTGEEGRSDSGSLRQGSVGL